jgi:hypothetical protein
MAGALETTLQALGCFRWEGATAHGVWSSRVARFYSHTRNPRAFLEREENKKKARADRDTRQNERYDVKHGRRYLVRSLSGDDPGIVVANSKGSAPAYAGLPLSRANVAFLLDATTRLASPRPARKTGRHPCVQGRTRQYAVQRSTFLTGSPATASVVRTQYQYRSNEAPKNATADRYRHANNAHRVPCRRRKALTRQGRRHAISRSLHSLAPELLPTARGWSPSRRSCWRSRQGRLRCDPMGCVIVITVFHLWRQAPRTLWRLAGPSHLSSRE